jgi:hypothetical protein
LGLQHCSSGCRRTVREYQWYDYASGAAAAREADAGHVDTAKDWQQSQAMTIYDTGNDPFSRSASTNRRFQQSRRREDWLATIRKVWSTARKIRNRP